MTGINPWWSYEEGAIPGAGKWMLNVGDGNLIVQDGDADIPERGINLAFQRTYNVLSQHDYANSDGSVPSLYGNGWTNTFDAHMAYDATANVLSVYDVDGARYDYCSTGTGTWASCTPGQYGTLAYDGVCSYLWTKKSGTVYHFWNPTGTNCDGGAGFNGRLALIEARNHNNWVRFDYLWTNGDASSPTNVTQINAVHADGQELTLTFADFNGRRLLSSITRPDGGVITYGYDANGDLTDVCKLCSETDGSAQHVQYGWNTTGALAWAASPNWVANNPAYPGAYVAFAQDGNGRTTSVQYIGIVNFTPSDGTNAVLQPGIATGAQTYRNESFNYGTANQTAYTDTDGHATTWSYDTVGRVTQTQAWTGSLWLTTTAGWDANNNLIATTDARGNETDYAYDGNGNTIAVALPQVSTSAGTIRPTSLYSYDRTNNANNIVAYCDPVRTNALGLNWSSAPAPTDSLCPNIAGSTRYVYDYSDASIEPFGRLTDAYTPLGYHHSFAYNTTAQGGDFGLPTQVAGDCISQLDGSRRCPSQSFTYDNDGNIATADRGTGAWHIAYDSLNRPTSRTDPDNVSSYTCYLASGDIRFTESASQHAADSSPSCSGASPAHAVAYSYDSDGDKITKMHHRGNTATNPVAAGVTTKYYDGDDRLVEVVEPHDPRTYPSGEPSTTYEALPYAWMTRYLYGLREQQTVTVDGASIQAYGNLYATEEYLPPTASNFGQGSSTANPQWTLLRGTSFDALDRALSQYEVSFGAKPKLTDAYGAGGAFGERTSSVNATGQASAMTYDADGHLTATTFSSDPSGTPARNYVYDADGRISGVSSSLGAAGYVYDADGRLTSTSEPAPNSTWTPATITYAYYPDGERSALSVASSQLTQSNLLEYAYRADGAKQWEQASRNGTFVFGWTYTAAGRELAQADPFDGKTIAVPDNNGGATRYVTIGPKTYTYDAYGRVASLKLPEGFTYGSETYDTDDAFAGYTGIDSFGTAQFTRAFNMNVRGEIVWDDIPWENPALPGVVSSPHHTDATIESANGNLISNNVGGADISDLRSGEKLASPGSNLATFQYDAAGRRTLTAEQKTYTYPFSAKMSQPIVTADVKNQAALTNDADNHISTITYASTCTASYYNASTGQNETVSCRYGIPPNGAVAGLQATELLQWGPDDRLRADTVTNSSGGASLATIHYDGSQPLFTVQGTGVEILIGTIGEIDSSGRLIVNDRDQTGTIAAQHTSTAFSSWYVAPVNSWTTSNVYNGGNPQTWMTIFAPGSCGTPVQPIDYYTPQRCNIYEYASDGLGVMQRPDGFMLGWPDTRGSSDIRDALVFQGARVYDNISSTWTSPDTYAGDTRDPMTQKPFVWNRNNAVVYSDPSGYCVEDACVGEIAAGAAIVEGGAELTAVTADAVGDEALAGAARGVVSKTASSMGLFAAEVRNLAGQAGAKAGAFARGIIGFSRHGLNQMISREGRGMSNEAFVRTLRTAKKAVLQDNGALKIKAKSGMIVINKAGKVITVAGKARIKEE